MSKKSKKAATGDCYDTALKYAAWEVPAGDRDRYRVVHGHPIGQGEIAGLKHGHAWVERTDPVPDDLPEVFLRGAADLFTVVIDKSNGKDLEVPRSLYYGLGSIDRNECRYYEVAEAMRLAVRHGHWGPWEDKPEIHECRVCGFTAGDVGIDDDEIAFMFAQEDLCQSCADGDFVADADA
jgi:hypothetical protein